ncbi:histidine phosphatase superfamily [Scheffersomyces xylosifermentans]|uniref:histidine phosphatase superfamily n=1 Tax=Scheffersomyces xylosifermentans TaxID=1304137 RepID=UPI00315D1034
MSLLIPTENDYDDAHGDIESEVAYREQFNKVKDEKDAEGKYLFPWSFEVVNGFFKQSDPKTDDSKFNYALEGFGKEKPWAEIIDELNSLNKSAKNNEVYKLIFFARHGQGYHNVCVNKYGLDEWKRKWHSLKTDGELVWAPDPNLTELGYSQSTENNEAWKREISIGAPIPSKFYVSPLQRSSRTLVNTWDDIKPRSLKPVVTESIRETIGVNLCDKRSTKTVIEERFGQYGFVIPPDFTEDDELFTSDHRETMVEQTFRVNSFLQNLFDEDLASDSTVDRTKVEDHTFISTTSHAGTIRCFIIALEHRHFTISTGGMIPIVVKATRKL